MGQFGLRWSRCLGVAAVGAVVTALVTGPAAAAPDEVVANGVTVVDPVLLRAGSTPAAVDTGDINGDGILDVAESNAHADTVHFIFGLGGGRFTGYSAQRTWFVDGRPSNPGLPDLVLTDVDADGLLDVAVIVTLASGDVVTVRLGTGDSALFGAPVSYAVPRGATDLTDADVNGDGVPDLLVVSGESDVVSVLLADGTGGLLAAAPVAVGDGPTGLDVADLDGDGDLDFAVTNSGSATVSIRFGDGSGTFRRAREVPVRPGPQDVAIADMDGDGHLDLVVGSDDDPAPDRSTVALYDGRRGFIEAGSYQTFQGILTVTALDWDGDDTPDIAVTTGIAGAFFGSNKGHLTIAAGGFGPDVDRYLSDVGNRPTGVAVADLDGDGDQDIASARSANYLALVFNPLG